MFDNPIALTAYHIITDIIIFVLPIKTLTSINRSKRDRILLFGLFGVSFFAVIIGYVQILCGVSVKKSIDVDNL